jgi:hypothetical protein
VDSSNETRLEIVPSKVLGTAQNGPMVVEAGIPVMHQQMDSVRKELPELVLEPLHHHHCDFFIQPNS